MHSFKIRTIETKTFKFCLSFLSSDYKILNWTAACCTTTKFQSFVFLIIIITKWSTKIIIWGGTTKYARGMLALFKRDFPVFLAEKNGHMSCIIWYWRCGMVYSVRKWVLFYWKFLKRDWVTSFSSVTSAFISECSQCFYEVKVLEV